MSECTSHPTPLPPLHEPRHRRFFHAVLDFIYPPACELCHSPLRGGRHLCEPCRTGLPRIRAPFCDHCGEIFDGNISSSFVCPNCQSLRYSFRFARPVLDCSNQARELIHGLKYQKNLYLARELARLATEAFADPRLQPALQERWTLVPVPLHRAREQQRFYNQSHEIARHLGAFLQLPVVTALARIRATPTQTRLSRRQRLKNLQGAIQLTRQGKALDPKETPGIILIDDVFTTGATVQECAKILSQNQHENVVVVTVMRG
jgi:competence protein ComFC